MIPLKCAFETDEQIGICFPAPFGENSDCAGSGGGVGRDSGRIGVVVVIMPPSPRPSVTPNSRVLFCHSVWRKL